MVEETCAICFGDESQRVDLPCRCKVSYCKTCWDIALARSFQACGSARCPSCRSRVHVDYSTEIEGLVFSLRVDAEDETPGARNIFSVLQNLASHQRKLAEQARPTQLKLLRKFGESLPKELQDEKALDASTLASIEGADSIDFRTLANRCQQEAVIPPQCICGMQFERVSSRERAVRWCQMNRPDLSPESQMYKDTLETLLEQSSSYCDLCDQSIPPGADLWTCKNGNSTILHSNAFDVCDRCLVSHSLNINRSQMQ